MTRIKRQVVIILLFILVILVVFNSQEQYDNFYFNEGLSSPQIQLSTLPDEIYKSIKNVEARAMGLQKRLSQQTGFGINTLPYSTTQYIHEGTLLVVQVYYSKSNQLLQEVSLIPEAFIGLSINELASIAGDWEVKSYQPGKSLLLYKKINELSPQDKNKIYLGVHEGKVAVFHGKPGSGELTKTTEINVEDLPYEEQQNLKKGILVDSREELYSILDGFISTINQD